MMTADIGNGGPKTTSQMRHSLSHLARSFFYIALLPTIIAIGVFYIGWHDIVHKEGISVCAKYYKIFELILSGIVLSVTLYEIAYHHTAKIDLETKFVVIAMMTFLLAVVQAFDLVVF